MLYKTLSAAVYGIDANIIQVEVDCSGIKCDQDHFHTVGLPDAAVRESRDRVRAALKNCGYDIPPTQITINLARADIKKEGSGFDLPMALGIVGAYGGLTKKSRTAFLSESCPWTAACVACVARCPSPSKHADGRSPAWSCLGPMPRRPRWWVASMSFQCDHSGT